MKLVNALNGKIKTAEMFKHITGTYTTSALGNANITELSGTDIIVTIKPPATVAVGFFGKGSQGGWYVHLVDSSGSSIASTQVTIDIYYV